MPRIGCRKKVDFKEFAKNGKYSWQIDPKRMDEPEPRHRVGRATQIACIIENRVYVNQFVREYEELYSLVAVDRAGYEGCLPRQREIEQRKETWRVLQQALKAVAFIASLAAVLAIFWYRRPLKRAVKRLLAAFASVGAK
jgi:hypothetical protein